MRLVRRLAQPPWPVLGGLVVVQWIAVAVFAASVRHNGWYWFQGGDQAWYWTTATALADGEFPAANVGYAWAVVLAPVAAVVGPSFLAALPAIVALQFLVLLPLALVAFYALVAPLLGARAAYAAAALWVVFPYAMIPFFEGRYHDRYVEQLLPQMLGLTAMADFPSLVAVLATSAFVVRALVLRSPVDAAAAGALAGLAVGVKPANAVVFPAAALALLVARRWRDLAAYGVAAVPFLVMLAVWKYRGTGQLPLLSLGETRLAAGAQLLALDVDSYLRTDWGRLADNRLQIREFFYSLRVVEWLPFAGAIAIARRSAPAAAYVLAWLALFVVVKGAAPQATVESGSFFRLLMPAFPALLALLVSLPLLVPGVVRRPAVARAGGSPLRPRWLVALLLVLIPVPLAAVILTRPVEGPQILQHYTDYTLLPADPGFELRRSGDGRIVRLSWDVPETGGTRPFYTVFRVQHEVDVRCNVYGESQQSCVFDSDQIAFTRGSHFVDRPTIPGVYVYRVGLSANWRDFPAIGDVVMLSRPLLVESA